MSITHYTKTVLEWEITCDADDCTNCYIVDYPSDVMNNGFVAVEQWNGLAYYSRHYCPECAPHEVKKLEDAGKQFTVIAK